MLKQLWLKALLAIAIWLALVLLAGLVGIL